MKITFKIHFFFFISIFISFITGHFKDAIIFTALILVHEMGHIIVGLLFKWKIEKVLLLPFGCITIFNQKLNASLKEEFLIAISGPIFQIIFYYLMNNEMINIYHYSILFFNLIPIYPLDGSKILNILFNKIMPFRYSYLVSIILSLIIIIILSIIIIEKFNLILLLIIIFLLKKVIEELLNIKYVINKFIFERYIYKIRYKNKKIIKNINNMYKEKYHYILKDKKLISENDYLVKMFDNHM